MNYAKKFFTRLVISSLLVNICLIFAAVMMLRTPGNIPMPTLLILMGESAGFILLVLVVLGRYARIFNEEFISAEQTGKQNDQSLFRLGGLPLRSLSTYVVLLLLYAASILPLSSALGIPPEQRTGMFLFSISFGLLGAAYIFINTDRLITRFLLNRNLVEYPASLRVDRQQRKIIIIPLFLFILAAVFTLACVLIVSGLAARDESGLSAQMRLSIAASIFIYVLIVFILVFSWAKGTSQIYQSIISQMDQLSSAEKDLTRRIRSG